MKGDRHCESQDIDRTSDGSPTKDFRRCKYDEPDQVKSRDPEVGRPHKGHECEPKKPGVQL